MDDDEVMADDDWRLDYRPALDGLRALAVLAVVLMHAGVPGFGGGGAGVDVFFVLSGFLITALMAQEWERTGGMDRRAFYRRRAIRLLPAAGLMLAVVTVLMVGLGLADRRFWVGVFGAVTYSQNLVGIHEQTTFGVIGHLWTLAVEEQFYIVWPVAFVALRRRWSRRTVAWIALAGAVAAVAWRAVAFERWPDWFTPERRADFRADSLLLGAALGAASVANSTVLRHRVWRRVQAPALVVLVVAGTVWESLHVPGAPLGSGLALLACATGVIVIGVAHGHNDRLDQALAWRPLRYLGRRSYGIYLWQTPIVWFAVRAGLSWPTVAALALAGSIVAAEVSWRTVESPMLRFKRHRPVSDAELGVAVSYVSVGTGEPHALRFR